MSRNRKHEIPVWRTSFGMSATRGMERPVTSDGNDARFVWRPMVTCFTNTNNGLSILYRVSWILYLLLGFSFLPS